VIVPLQFMAICHLLLQQHWTIFSDISQMNSGTAQTIADGGGRPEAIGGLKNGQCRRADASRYSNGK